MGKKRFFIGPVTWILVIIILFVSYILAYALFSGLYKDTKVIVYGSLALIFGLIWLIYVLTSSYILIKDNQILFPKQYKMNLQFIFGLTFLIALFKRRKRINIKDISSVDLVVGYTDSLESLHQPLTITLKDGTKEVFFMKFYSKKTVMNILKNMKQLNPKINFLKSCKEMIELKSPFKMTETEKQDFRRKRGLLFFCLGIIVVMFLFIFFVNAFAKYGGGNFDINNISIRDDFREGHYNEKRILVSTEQGPSFVITYKKGYVNYGEVTKFLDALNTNKSLYAKTSISYKQLFGERSMKAIKAMNITLSDGRTFNVGLH